MNIEALVQTVPYLSPTEEEDLRREFTLQLDALRGHIQTVLDFVEEGMNFQATDKLNEILEELT